ncbi:hypothetical protein [Spongiactinospora sp. TRM90649]|uniref:hypothetical protein n=1 Tax=Spongiactinospora sp. TRM90649 TaxID=3031114 RepID=UPI0023F7089D|nr:hypothetical protein [Spongiactinospora sp. TRM90649]MDF5755818.1 hypothetical protein [Spongiactinospora sp. TRM90649]
MAHEYADLATLKLSLTITATADEPLLTRALAAASRAIDKRCGRRFWLDDDPSARIYHSRGRVVRDERGELLLIDDIGSLAGLAVEAGAGGSWSAVAGAETLPENALAQGQAVTGLLLASGTWGTGTGRVRVTARWGWPSVPEEIEQATLLQAGRLYNRKHSPAGIAGSENWGFLRVPQLDPDVRVMTDPYMKPGFA